MAVRPVLLVGCPRSGTTLLSAMLHAHPSIAVAPETRFLLPAYQQRRRFGDLTDPHARRRLGEFITRRESLFPDLKIDRDDVVRAAVDAAPSFGSVVATVWQTFAADRAAKRWVEKRPAYWREMPTLTRLFPDAQVIHLVRDPRAVVASLMPMRWYRRPLPHAVAMWVQADRELRRWGRGRSSRTYHRLRYEDLATDPRRELARLCDFVGERFDPRMLDHGGAADDLVPPRKTWHNRVREPLDTSRMNAWQLALSPEDVGLIEFGARFGMRRNGYLPDRGAGRPAAQTVLEFERLLVGMRVNMIKDRASDAVQRRRFPMALAADD